MPLPISGIISASQVGVYVFNRGATAEFSLSASLAGSTVNKGYTTTLGPLWRGTSDADNPQWNQGANNFSLSDWYGYWKGFELTILLPFQDDSNRACSNTTEGAVYVTDSEKFGGPSGPYIVNASTIGYSNTDGTTLYGNPGTDGQWVAILEMNNAYQMDPNGQFVNETPC